MNPKFAIGAHTVDRRIGIALVLVGAQPSETLTARAVAKEVRLSRSRFEHLFKEGVGWSFGSRVRFLRLERAKHLLEDPRVSVKEVATKCGYSVTAHFTRAFRKQFGVNPTQFRRSKYG